MRQLIGILILFGGLCVGQWPARAATPWYVDENGTGIPYTWSNGALPWFIEQQSLGPVPFQKVLEIVADAFASWQSAGLHTATLAELVSTTKVTPSLAGIIKQQIDVGNVEQYLGKQVVVIMDPAGEIIRELPGITAENVKGVAAATVIGDEQKDATTLTLRTGITVLNGVFLEGADPTNEKDPQILQFKSSVTHEIGHLFNLDHSALNQDMPDTLTASDVALSRPTMYPLILEGSDAQANLHEDDVVAISDLYPRSEYTQKFCTIAGKLIGADQKGFQGALIMARAKRAPHTEGASAITGANFPEKIADGSYFIRGIKPGVAYIVEYAEVKPSAIEGSGIGPYYPPRSGFGSEIITASGGTLKEVKCDKGGQTIVMDIMQLSIAAGGEPAVHSKVAPPPDPPGSSTNGTASGGCSVIVR